MSWATCYSGSNNIHFNFPALMSDSRTYTNWYPEVVIDKQIKKENNLKNNSEYRKYLQNNADTIIKNNQLSSCDECSTCPYFHKNIERLPTTKPYIFDSILSQDKPYGYETSDLKNIYLTRQSLEAQMHAPQFIIPSEEKNE